MDVTDSVEINESEPLHLIEQQSPPVLESEIFKDMLRHMMAPLLLGMLFGSLWQILVMPKIDLFPNPIHGSFIIYLILSPIIYKLLVGIRELIKFFKSLIVKFGLAASCIKTFLGLYFLINLSPIKDESDLSFPPLIIKTIFEYFFLICFLSFITNIIFLNSFDFKALSTECSKSALFLYFINCLSLEELNLLLCPEASIIK